jgi:hypothetical protein
MTEQEWTMTVINDLDAARLGDDDGVYASRTALLDKAHLGDIQGALGSIAEDDFAPRLTLRARIKTLVAILGPGLIVMVGDNDAGAFGTYTQAGHTWRMSPLDKLPPARLSTISRIWMIVLRSYLVVAAGLVLFRILQLATVGM